MSVTGLLAVLRGEAEHAVEAMRNLRIAGPWTDGVRHVEFDGKRLDEGDAIPVDEGILVVVEGSDEEGWTFDTDPRSGLFPSRKLAERAADEHHKSEGWTLRSAK